MLDSLVGELSLERKIHQLIVVGGTGPTSTVMAAVEAALDTPCVGGVFVADTQGNWAPVSEPDAAMAAVGEITELSAPCAIAPVVSTDAEAGTRVLKVPVDPLPPPNRLADDWREDTDAVRAEFRAEFLRFASEIRALGVHVNFGVVADVDVDDAHYMARRGRSFGDDPELVADLTALLVEGHCRAGLAPVVKHFPNQGATLTDPHDADSVSSHTPAEWSTHGRIPYEGTRAPVVMTGHVRFDGVDGGRPASMSHELTTGWLREDLGFDGVVVTDDLFSMRGAALEGEGEAGPGARAVAAIEAGADLALFVSPTVLPEVVDALFARAGADRSFSARIDESVARVLRLKAAFGLVDGLEPAWFPVCPSA